jgi:hypothetical protein
MLDLDRNRLLALGSAAGAARQAGNLIDPGHCRQLLQNLAADEARRTCQHDTHKQFHVRPCATHAHTRN